MPVTARLSRKFYERFGNAFDLKLSAFETRLIRWMFLFWVSTLGTIIALLKL